MAGCGNWYPWFPGDFARDTKGLTHIEKSIYRELLDCYYSNGEPLPNSQSELRMIAVAMSKAERDAVTKVIAKFFTLGNDGLFHNKRADKQLAEIASTRARLAAAGQRRWQKPSDMPLDSKGSSKGSSKGRSDRTPKAGANPQPHPQRELPPQPPPAEGKDSVVEDPPAAAEPEQPPAPAPAPTGGTAPPPCLEGDAFAGELLRVDRLHHARLLGLYPRRFLEAIFPRLDVQIAGAVRPNEEPWSRSRMNAYVSAACGRAWDEVVRRGDESRFKDPKSAGSPKVAPLPEVTPEDDARAQEALAEIMAVLAPRRAAEADDGWEAGRREELRRQALAIGGGGAAR